VFDGLRWGDIGTIYVNTIAKPTLAGEEGVIVEELDIVPIDTIFTKVDTGPAFVSYEVYETNGFQFSGQLQLDGSKLNYGHQRIRCRTFSNRREHDRLCCGHVGSAPSKIDGL